ncbi:hypothetical protein [Bradyrhizobium sp. CCGB01]|uniref:hypothetical protein n=1 Tax=Bradyrhizobium sp. CCGB01 TaxID=2949634 RepID=UPI002811E10F|nr:hypothetical protein [Bradyrhizobium sp. CCGB01]
MNAVFSFSIGAKLLTPQLRLVSVSYPELRRGGGGRRAWYIYAHGATTMLALGLVLNALGIGLFCWAIFSLAVYALPFYVALSIGMTAFQSGAGLIGTLLIATAGGKRVHGVRPTQTAPRQAKISRQANDGNPIRDRANAT